MSTQVVGSWWQQYREAVRCSKLDRELTSLVREEELAAKLIDREKNKHPGKLESWYLVKVIDKLRTKKALDSGVNCN